MRLPKIAQQLKSPFRQWNVTVLFSLEAGITRFNTVNKPLKTCESVDMSIFPKRTIAGSTVTIHWNLTLPPTMETALCPYVRIGINCPDGNTYMLFEEHVLLLPSTAAPTPPALQQNGLPQYLNKHTPLLVLASYLQGQQSREKLIDILTNLQNGRHYYFTWTVPTDAPPGKYTLLSEMHLAGSVKQSGTAAEDFFYVEQLNISKNTDNAITIHNPGPERVPAKFITYAAGHHQQPEALEVFYLEPGDSRLVTTTGKSIFLVYNEERITIPLHAWQQQRVLRNQQHHYLQKEEAGEPVSYVLPREGNEAWRLNGRQRALWEAADGMHTRASLREKDNTLYDEMMARGLIKEIS